MTEAFLDRLVDYLAGELDDTARDSFEEELFAGEGVAGIVSAQLAIQDGIRQFARRSALRVADLLRSVEPGLRELMRIGIADWHPEYSARAEPRIHPKAGFASMRPSWSFLGRQAFFRTLRRARDETPRV